MRAKFHQTKCSDSWVINSGLHFGQLWTSDREYLWNGSSNRQAENGLSNYDFSAFDENNLINFGPLKKKWPWPLTYDLEIQWGSCGCQGTSRFTRKDVWFNGRRQEASTYVIIDVINTSLSLVKPRSWLVLRSAVDDMEMIASIWKSLFTTNGRVEK